MTYKTINREDCFSNEDMANFIYGYFRKNIPPDIKVLNFEYNFEFRDLVPNESVAPENAERNWVRNTTKPLGYPGWIGYLRFEVSEPLPKRFPNYLKGSLVHPLVVHDAKYWNPTDLEQCWTACFFLSDWKQLELAAGLTNNNLEGFHGYFDYDDKWWTNA